MKKMIVGFTFLVSLSGFAQEFQEDYRSVGNTLERVETDNNAVCKFKRSTRSFSNMIFSWNRQYYSCVSNEGEFELKFLIKRTRDVAQPFIPGSTAAYGKAVVTRITITK